MNVYDKILSYKFKKKKRGKIKAPKKYLYTLYQKM